MLKKRTTLQLNCLIFRTTFSCSYVTEGRLLDLETDKSIQRLRSSNSNARLGRR
uniref:Uncharacterized protein n=1 Tax=Arundo donax TaxID=35708 RepID=A0A0A9A890_ARUDO